MSDVRPAIEQVQAAFTQAVTEAGSVHGIPMIRLNKQDVPMVAHFIHTNPGLRGALSMLWAVDHRPREARYELWYLFTLAERKDWVFLVTDLRGNEREFPSITPALHAAKWYEREIRDLFGLIPIGHPDMRRLVRHEHWPKGTHPLRKDFHWDSVLDRVQGQYAFRKIQGEGVFEVPVGPIHAGIIEPGHFRFSVAGEPIMQLELRHFWKHRGIEKLFEQQHLTAAAPLSERVSGDTTIGHSLAYCQAVETLFGMAAPQRARYLRSLFLELERLHNHIGDVGAICNDTAYVLAHAHCGRMKEQLMQLNDRLAGSRFLRGVNCVGGVTIDVTDLQLAHIVAELDVLERDFSSIEKILFANASLTERLENTGVLTERQAWDHAVIGVVGRASGMDRDIRRDRPFAAYDELQPKVALYRYGDVRARMRVRLDEVHESIRLVREIGRRMPRGPLTVQPVREPAPGEWAMSAVEGWRGEVLYMVMAGGQGRIHRCKVRDPSFVNWPAIQWAALGNIIPDFPLINKSFNLSYAGNDL
ncbi:MAG: putative Formate hydrogenlyase, large subunit [Nitrospira sp.]|jgi:Ni,Fe-hydrogenase III large subunit/Ni,Fe-hydrogenase III component G|nr:putative Formate hydrogenlyase, large subunit [Nitrospira sp.]